MYRCRYCGSIFEEPYRVYDDPSPRGVSLPSGSYVYNHCPSCHSDRIEEMGECSHCGEPCEKGKLLCDTCREDFKEYLFEAGDKMGLTKDEFEEAIVEAFEW